MSAPESRNDEAPSGANARAEWLLRPLFGLLLAAAALGALLAGGGWFAAFIALGTTAGAREWHRLTVHGRYLPFASISAAAVVLGLLAAVLDLAVFPSTEWAYAVALAFYLSAAAANIGLASARRENMWWAMGGPLYLGLPGLSLYALRATPGHGVWLVLLLFVAIWGCDTGGLVFGRLIGGPKLAPRLSPKKTWAGLAGGTCVAGAASAAVMAALGDDLWRGALFGVIIGLIGQAGDMFESWVKRRMGRKDSGSLIPGHGGMLDRIDSLLFAAPACAAFVFVFSAQAIFGGLP